MIFWFSAKSIVLNLIIFYICRNFKRDAFYPMTMKNDKKMAKPIRATPKLKVSGPRRFLKQMKEAETGKLTQKDIEIAKRILEAKA